jgi:hypothetical protein
LAYLDQFAAPQEVDPRTEASLGGCDTCHVDVADACVGSPHFEQEVGCISCHGPSEGHVAEENNEIQPDEVFARDDVDRVCSNCHACSRPGQHGADPPPTADGHQKVCTECHAAHAFLAAQAKDPSKD